MPLPEPFEIVRNCYDRLPICRKTAKGSADGPCLPRVKTAGASKIAAGRPTEPIAYRSHGKEAHCRHAVTDLVCSRSQSLGTCTDSIPPALRRGSAPVSVHGILRSGLRRVPRDRKPRFFCLKLFKTASSGEGPLPRHPAGFKPCGSIPGHLSLLPPYPGGAAVWRTDPACPAAVRRTVPANAERAGCFHWSRACVSVCGVRSSWTAFGLEIHGRRLRSRHSSL
jgi:hypothetical protein